MRTDTLVHIRCEMSITLVERTVITRPEDRSWPKNDTIALPYCGMCRMILGLDQIEDRCHHSWVEIDAITEVERCVYCERMRRRSNG